MKNTFIVLFITQLMQEYILIMKIHTLSYLECNVSLLSLSPFHADLILLSRGNFC